jgi:tetratricopeptide (TPR) repeat protein
MSRLFKIISLFLILFLAAGCVYYNTFYHAKKAFKEAEARRMQGGRSGAKAGASGYKKAIEKTDKVIEKWPNSKYYDDALYLNGVSHYYTENYGKAEKRFREIVVNYPESKFFRESRLYLAKSRLKLGEEASAMSLFEELFSESKDKEIKAEAALALGEYYFENKQYDNAENYFSSLIDSLGNDETKAIAKMYIAESYFARLRYKQALENYLEILDYDLTTQDRFNAMFRIGDCYYYLNDIEEGLEYFFELAENELYYDSLASTKLRIARGYEWEGDLVLAEEMYEQVAVENPHRPAGGIANYNLGLIYQYDYEDYKKAKEYYDKAKSLGGRSDIYQDALERSSNIGKLQEYLNREEFDTTATLEEIDGAAETQYLLAELYLMQLAKPDSALQEFEYIPKEFPESYLAPKALIAIALMKRDYYDDTAAFTENLRRVLKEYPRSDFVPEAIGMLGLAGTIADSGYAAQYYEKAERFIFDENNIDSAGYYYKLVADSFPRSSLNNRAKFALLWMKETYVSPGDSSLYYEYAYFADSFPNTEFGRAASDKLVVKPRIVVEDEETGDTVVVQLGEKKPEEDTTVQRILTPEEKYHIDPNGITVFEVQRNPNRFDKEFIYPPAAYGLEFEGELFLYFQVKINPFGEVDEIRLMNPTPYEELDQEATETVMTAHWDNIAWIPPELMDSWWVYKYPVKRPSSLR